MRQPSIPSTAPWLICLSHLRWNFVFQRPQHIMTRLAERQNVLFFEEPVPVDEPGRAPYLHERVVENGVRVVVPHLDPDVLTDPRRTGAATRQLLDELLRRDRIASFTLWYYSPMALAFTDHLKAEGIIFDCMDELSAFAGAPPDMIANEALLLQRADLVLTGGRSLYEAKRNRHPNVHCCPSSVDAPHFRQARAIKKSPPDQASIPGPRLGFAGVIDERMDLPLLAGVAAARPDWNLIMVGPVVKIDPATLPRAPNIHYLGMKAYDDLPSYMGGWDVGLLPFARNAATRFISPTKTPEYLSAGLPVVSTSIRDVAHPYGDEGLAIIADGVSEFVSAVDTALGVRLDVFREQADRFLENNSWDNTVNKIANLIEESLNANACADGLQPVAAAV